MQYRFAKTVLTGVLVAAFTATAIAPTVFWLTATVLKA